jgi:single-strand DNA-binding protein
MIGVNKAILIGRLGNDPELRRTANGTSVASFSLATSERWNNKNGETQDRTEWHNIVTWGKLADLSGQYLKKGRSIYIEGKIATRSWDDNEGKKRYKTEIIANQILFLDSNINEMNNEMQPNHNSLGSDNTNTVVSESTSDSDSDIIEDDLPF